MDEVIQPVPSQPAPTVQPIQQAPAQGGLYFAGVGERFVAVLIDGLILGAVNVAISIIFGMLKLRGVGTLLSYPINWGYMIYFIGSTGQTIGKKVMKIKVIKVDGSQPTFVDAFLREVVGKIISSLVLLLGYFWAIWDSNKQTWHDKIAKTYVVKA